MNSTSHKKWSNDHIKSAALLFSAMTKADGRTLEVENESVGLLFKSLQMDKASDYFETYSNAIHNKCPEDFERILAETVNKTSKVERLELMRSCIYIAKCDSELHEKEIGLLLKIRELLNIEENNWELLLSST